MVHVKLSIAFVLAAAAIAPVVAQPIRQGLARRAFGDDLEVREPVRPHRPLRVKRSALPRPKPSRRVRPPVTVPGTDPVSNSGHHSVGSRSSSRSSSSSGSGSRSRSRSKEPQPASPGASSAVPGSPSADSSVSPPGDSKKVFVPTPAGDSKSRSFSPSSAATPSTREYVEGLEIRVVPATASGDTPPLAVAPVDGVAAHAGPTGTIQPQSSSTVSAVPHLPHPGSLHPHERRRQRGQTVSLRVHDSVSAQPTTPSKSSFVRLGGREFIDVQDLLERSLEDLEFEAREFEDFDLDARDFEDEFYLD